MSSRARSLAGVSAWKIFTGLSIRRPAVVTPQLSPLQEQVGDMLRAIEFEKSHLSAHELRDKIEEARLQNAKGQKASQTTTTTPNTEASLLTAREQELLWQAELDKFRPADRVTDDDRANNVQSAWRALDHPLFMICKQSLGNETPTWGLPVIPVPEGYTLRQTADLFVDKYLPKSSKCRIFGNAPSAVHVYKYRENKSGEKTGVQMYFFNAYVDRVWHGDQWNLSSLMAVDFAWIRSHELTNYVTDPKMLRVLRSFMVEY